MKYKINKTNLKLLNECMSLITNFLNDNLILQINPVIVKINPTAKYSGYLVDDKTIILNIKEGYRWQIIYLLSHEMMHHVIYQVENKTNKEDNKVSKAQETLCTAFSFFVLKKLNFNKNLNNEILRLKDGSHLYSKYKFEIMRLYNILITKENVLESLIYKCINNWNLERGFNEI